MFANADRKVYESLGKHESIIDSLLKGDFENGFNAMKRHAVFYTFFIDVMKKVVVVGDKADFMKR